MEKCRWCREFKIDMPAIFPKARPLFCDEFCAVKYAVCAADSRPFCETHGDPFQALIACECKHVCPQYGFNRQYKTVTALPRTWTSARQPEKKFKKIVDTERKEV